MEETIAWTFGISVLATSCFLFFGKNFIRAWITKGVEHHFNSKIETLRAELLEKEEKLKSDLRSKEGEISALRQGALLGAIKRREALDNRKLEAVDRFWTEAMSLAPLKMASAFMKVIDFESSAKRTQTHPNARDLFKMLGQSYDTNNIPKTQAAKERPFLSEKAWALFNAYQTILYFGVAQLKILEIGVNDASAMLNQTPLRKLIKETLPHQIPLLDEFGISACHHLVDELEQELLKELRSGLTCDDTSKEDLVQAANILKASKDLMGSIPGELASNP